MRSLADTFCPVQRTARLLTRRWMPLVILELMVGRSRFNDLRRAVPKISPGLLAQRLRELQQAGLVVRRRADGTGRQEYHLTPAGEELRPVIEGMGAWGRRWMERRISRRDYDAGTLMWDIRGRLPQSALPERRVTILFSFVDAPTDLRNFWLVLDGGVDLCIRDPGYIVDIKVRTDATTMADVWLGELPYDAALRRGNLVVTGALELRRKLPDWLGLRVPTRGPVPAESELTASPR